MNQLRSSLFLVPNATKLKTCAILAILFLASAPALAGHYELIRKDDPNESYQFSDTEGVCAAFEKNLRQFEDRPYGMACKRELDPKLGFSRPMWQKLEIMQHLDLVMDILRFSGRDKTQPTDPRPWPERIKDMVEKQNLTLELTRLDLNRDGKPDNLVRFGFDRACDPQKVLEQGLGGRDRTLYVIDSAMKKVDQYSRYMLVYDDVFQYNGKVYTDTFWNVPLTIRSIKRRDGALYLFEFNRHGAAPNCKLHYYDSPSSKEGK